MKPPAVPLEAIRALPAIFRQTIPETYQDENGHMNMRWYLALFDDAGYPLSASFGLTGEFHTQHDSGGYDLEHHLHYLREVMVGDDVTIYARLLGRSAKRIHYMMFMVNEMRGALAATFECVNSFADMRTRRTAPYPSEIAARIDALLAVHQVLDWTAPVSGIMSA
ncbi:MAG: thioesterase family protein [Anaerolineae bacterium]|nr:thioesterase family protein [Anaerolineae bacterium]NUQ03179.1 thioesterase family protein [Anaerolineae bacterium]